VIREQAILAAALPGERPLHAVEGIVVFEVASEGEEWSELARVGSPPSQSERRMLGLRSARWDASGVAPGWYRVRAVLERGGRRVALSEPVEVEVGAAGERSGGEGLPPGLEGEPISAERRCLCESIVLLGDDLPGERVAFGADGRPGADPPWNAFEGKHDGKSLGPLSGDPVNAGRAAGYKFQVLAAVDGTPQECREVQLARGTITARGVSRRQCENDRNRKDGWVWNEAEQVCEQFHDPKGREVDVDLDGIRESFPEEKTFPLGGEYGPDNYTFGDGVLKTYPFRRILWWDAPSMTTLPAGSTFDAELVAAVRGTDDLYCYLEFALHVEWRQVGTVEELTLRRSEVRATRLP
jgi:hypothetical protein